MNAPFPTPQSLERHKFTGEDIRDLTERGLVPKRAVLLDGEIYDMPSDGDAHIAVTMALMRYVAAVLSPALYFIGVQTTLRLSRHNEPSPDIYVLAGGAPPVGEVAAERILLVIEVADTSLRDDLKSSASRYARHNVREFWVIDVNAREVHVHREPADGDYRSIAKHSAQESVQALIPELSIQLDTVAPAQN